VGTAELLIGARRPTKARPLFAQADGRGPGVATRPGDPHTLRHYRARGACTDVFHIGSIDHLDLIPAHPSHRNPSQNLADGPYRRPGTHSQVAAEREVVRSCR
jgi:hypothetical protein